MRNLKRALSLTLASVMLLGMMVVGSSAAAGYSDVDENDNVEAIEVLQAIEVMVGDDRGFGPDRPVTRNEMAVVMGKLLNLNYNYYVSSCPFTDVADWAKGWVGACAANGIVSGRGNGIYDGESTVTAIEAASMMMRALGYFKNVEDYADGFQVVTVRQGSEIGIFNDVGTDATTPMTRNQVAQMALNALRSNMVNFTGTPGIEVNGVKVGYKAEYTPRTGTEAKYDAITGLTTTILSDNGQYFIQLGEQLYDGDLRLDEGIDDYGRPARHWEYDGKGIGTYAKRELMRKDYTTKVTGSDMYTLLGSSVVTDAKYSLDVYVDGALYTAADTATNRFIKANFTRSNGKTMEHTGRGVLTEVYVDNQDKEITVAVINTFLAQATSDYSSAREELRVRVYNTSVGTTHTLEVEDFPQIADMKEDDFMLVKWTADKRDNWSTYTDYEVATVLDTEVLTDKAVTKFTHDNAVTTGNVTSLVADGQTYDGNKNLNYDVNELNKYNDNRLTDKTYNVYLDQYGNAIGVDLYSGEDNYVFITGFDLNGSNTATANATANAIFLDGTMASIKVNTNDTNKNIRAYNADPAGDGTGAGHNSDTATYREWDSDTEKNATGGYGSRMNTWYKYTKSETTDVYTLKPVDQDKQFATEVGSAANAGAFEIKSGSLRLSGHNYGEIAYNAAPTKANLDAKTAVNRSYGDQNSVFITVGTSEDVKVGGQYYVIDEVKSVYTGVQNVNIKSDNIWYEAASGKYDSGATYTEDTGASSVYALIGSDKYIIGAIIIGKDSGSTSNYAYIYDYAKYEEKTDGVYYWGFDAIVNGEKQSIVMKSEYEDAVDTIHNVLKAAADDDGLNAPYGNDDKGYLFYLSFDKDNYVVSAKAFNTELGTASSSTGGTVTHNDYIWAHNKVTDDADSPWAIKPKDEIIRYMKLSATENSNKGDVITIDREGLTLYVEQETNDAGLAVRPDAKVTVIQGIHDDRTVRTYDGLKEAWDYLVDYHPDSEDTKNYAGTISAVLNANGEATWVVFDSKGGTGIKQNEEQTQVNVPTVKVASGADAAAIKLALKAQKYGVYAVDGLSGAFPGAPRASDAKNIRCFTFNTKANNAKAELIITDKDNQVCYSEAEATIATAGFHYYFVDIGAGPRTGGVAGTVASGDAFPKGTYTYTIRITGQDEFFTGTFEVG